MVALEVCGIIASVNMAYAILITIIIIAQKLNNLTIHTIACIDLYLLYECLIKLVTT